MHGVGTRASQSGHRLELHEASAVCPDMQHGLDDRLPHVSAAGHQPARAAATLPGSGVVALGSMRARRAWGDSSGWVSMTTVRSSGDTFGKHVQGPWHEAKHQMSKRLLCFESCTADCEIIPEPHTRSRHGRNASCADVASKLAQAPAASQQSTPDSPSTGCHGCLDLCPALAPLCGSNWLHVACMRVLCGNEDHLPCRLRAPWQLALSLPLGRCVQARGCMDWPVPAASWPARTCRWLQYR